MQARSTLRDESSFRHDSNPAHMVHICNGTGSVQCHQLYSDGRRFIIVRRKVLKYWNNHLIFLIMRISAKGEYMEHSVKIRWIPCPSCGKNTRTKVREDTVLYHQPLFCPKCRKEFLVNVKQFKMQIVKEPDPKTQCWFTKEIGWFCFLFTEVEENAVHKITDWVPVGDFIHWGYVYKGDT